SAQGIMPGTGSTDAAPAQPAAPTDPLGRQVPQGLVTGLLRAMADEDYVRAARYLDLRDIPEQRRAYRGPVLAHQLQQILDKGGWVDANWQLSTDPQGLMDDNLPPDRESF